MFYFCKVCTKPVNFAKLVNGEAIATVGADKPFAVSVVNDYL